MRFASDDEGGIGAARTVMMMAHNEIKISLNMLDEGGEGVLLALTFEVQSTWSYIGVDRLLPHRSDMQLRQSNCCASYRFTRTGVALSREEKEGTARIRTLLCPSRGYKRKSRQVRALVLAHLRSDAVRVRCIL